MVSFPPPPPWDQPPGYQTPPQTPLAPRNPPPPRYTPQTASKKSHRGLLLGLLAGLILLLFVVGAAYLASAATGGTPLGDLRRGDCFNLSKGLFGQKANRVRCSAGHTDEVAGGLSLAPGAGDYPGRDGILELGKGGCPAQVAEFYAQKPPAAAETFVFGPDKAAWNKGERAVVCSLREPSVAKRTGSYLDG